jgi:membrane carboxypeptidase/penicillin-binding protein
VDGFDATSQLRGGAGVVTLRRGLEDSRNLATANLMANGIENTPEQGLDRICDLAVEAQLYKQCSRFYPFVLGAQPLRLIDLAAFYAAIANEGARPVPHAIDSIAQQGREIFKADPNALVWIGDNDRASFFQLKSMLQGVLARGTARSAKHLSAFAAGKTGTTDDELDAWFVGFTNDVTVAIWVGYDNADGNRRTLGRGQTGGHVALPMFEPILQSVWAVHAPKTALNGPSKEAMRELVAVRIDAYTGDTDEYGDPRRAQGGTIEYMKRSASGGVADTRYKIVSGGQNYAYRFGDGFDEDGTPMQQQRSAFDGFGGFFGFPPNYNYGRRAPPNWQGFQDDDNSIRSPRRVDPDYLFGERRY